MKQKVCQRYIYKLPSSVLRKAHWDLELPLSTAIAEYPRYIVSISDSQALRFIDEINGVENADEEARDIKRKIKIEKRKPRSKNTKSVIAYLYKKLYDLQFQKDYLCVVMERLSDYDRANEGFSINGIRYHRFLGTNGGVKNSTIVYVSEQVYPELKRRLDNGRDMTKELVPAKLEAYQALLCSGSTPLPPPSGVIVVDDCITHFTEDVIVIDNSAGGEPITTYEKDYPIEHNDSDGCGLMLPAYSRRINQYLNGDDKTVAGVNTRWAWNKGMIYTFDYIEFAEKVAHTYEVTDVWGDKRDVRDAEVILTASMLKLWDSYRNWEDYYSNCCRNHYQFATPKVTPDELEPVRDTNYQFLQSYSFTDAEIKELCEPTVNEIKDVLGMDYRKSLVFMTGFGLNEDNAFGSEYDYCAKALMADERMVDDPFIRRRIWNMICKRIEMGKRGAIRVNANFAMISGDPYAFCQSMFGLEITGLMSRGELYHKYWIDKGSTELACFRAPMTCHNNIRRLKLADRKETRYWYRYMDTVAILNAFDTTCDAMNGADKDGDTNMDTDNPIILKNTLNSPTIMCMQKKAEKKVPIEEDMIQANKLAFNDDIGRITNYVTSMIERQAGFEKGSEEYNTLDYRIKCGQLFQQDTIDRIKGIVAKPMPNYWYNPHKCTVKDEDDAQVRAMKEKNMKVVAANKPYFMIYVYPTLRKQVREYFKNNDYSAILHFNNYGIRSVDDLYAYEPKTKEMEEFLERYEKHLPVGLNDCVINRMCRLFEREFDGYLSKKYEQPEFDYTIMKSNVGYSKNVYHAIEEVFERYINQMNAYKNESNRKRQEPDWADKYQMFVRNFRMECEIICSNEDELCDIVLDLCYGSTKTKQFAWDIAGDIMLRNLLRINDYKIHIPVHTHGEGEFKYCGESFLMQEVDVKSGEETDL